MKPFLTKVVALFLIIVAVLCIHENCHNHLYRLDLIENNISWWALPVALLASALGHWHSHPKGPKK